MSGGDLFNQGGAGTRHADNKNRQRGADAASLSFGEQGRAISIDNPLHQTIMGLCVKDMASALPLDLSQIVAVLKVGKGLWKLSLFVVNFSQGKMQGNPLRRCKFFPR